MGKILFCVDSYFQLIGSINLRFEIYKDYHADLIIYNTTPTANRIYSEIKKTDIFDNVYIAKTKLALVGDNVSKIKKMPKYVVYLKSVFCPRRVCKRMIGCKLENKYDFLFFHGYGAILECVFNVCHYYNNNVKCYRIDDGLGTYLDEWSAPKWKSRQLFEKIFYPIAGFESINNYIVGYYVSDPDLMTFKPKYPVFSSPKLNKSNIKFVTLLNRIFGYSCETSLSKVRLIYFGTWGDGVKSDLELLNGIKSVVKPSEILIKVHPREDMKKYENLGIKIMDRSDVPWEVVMLNVDLSDRIFVTLDSTAVFTSRLYFERGKGKDCYCFRCSNIVLQRLQETMRKWISFSIKKYGEDNIYAPQNMDELLKILKGLL